MSSQLDNRYYGYVIYTSDVPHASVVYPEYKHMGDYLYLRERIDGLDDEEVDDRKFVSRLPPCDLELESISILDDILSHLISYAPAMWYTVSKFCKIQATKAILQSNHIRRQWDNGAILLKAFHEKKPEILNIFLCAGWELSSDLLMHARRKKIVQKLVEYEHIRKLVKQHRIVLNYLACNPDAVMTYFNDVKQFDRVEENDSYDFAYECLYDANRPDLIDSLYSRKELDTRTQYYMDVIDYAIGKTSITKAANLPNSVNSDFHNIIVACRKYLKSREYPPECVERLIQVIRSHVTGGNDMIFEWYVEDENIEKVKEYLSKGISLETVCQCAVSLVETSPTAPILHEYLLAQTDYSNVYSYLWFGIDTTNVHVFKHFVTHGYSVGPNNTTRIPDELRALIGK